MQFILEHIYLLIFVAAGIAQWVNSQREAKKAEKEAQQRQGRSGELEQEEDFFGPDFDFDETHEDHEREVVRRQPSAANPPPLPSGRSTTPTGPPQLGTPAPVLVSRRERAASIPARDTRFEEELARQATLLEQVRLIKQRSQADAIENAVATRASAAYEQTTNTRGQNGLSLKSRLRDRRELKQAFILKEILEKPVSLRS